MKIGKCRKSEKVGNQKKQEFGKKIENPKSRKSENVGNWREKNQTR